MLTFIVFIHIIVCILLVVVVLLQSSKGGGLAGAFGGAGGMGAVFGGRGAATFLSKVTIILVTLFMLSNLVQSFITRSVPRSKSLIQQEMQKEESSSAADMLPKIEGQGSQTLPAPIPGQPANVDTSGK